MIFVMEKKLTPGNPYHSIIRFYLLFFIASLWSVRSGACALSASLPLPPSPVSFSKLPLKPVQTANDTVKYQGYRLDLTGFTVIKKTDDWIKIRFTVVNSGRKDVDFSKKGTEHWAQVNFDQSIFDLKLGGLRENIRHALYKEGFSLAAGEIVRNKDLKVPAFLPFQPGPEESSPEISFTERSPRKEASEEQPVFTSKGSGDDTLPAPEILPDDNEDCPDIFFTHLQILEQDDKWATIEYGINNQGKGRFQLFGTGEAVEKLAIRAYISGVPVLSRGALPIGGQLVSPSPGMPDYLGPGESYTGKIRLDIRKKTRYMKSLILSLESDQFARECDKTNNSKAVILD